MSKILNEMERNLKEIGDFLERELKDIKGVVETDLRSDMKQHTKETICNKLREIYMLSNDMKIKELAVESTIMAKKMMKRIVEYYRKEND